MKIKNITPPKDIKELLEKNFTISKDISSEDQQTYQYSTFFKETIQSGDIVRVLKVDGSNITIEKIKNNF